MIMSALIAQCRGQFNDIPKSTQSTRAADGTSTLFNLGRFPIMEGSYSVYFDNTAKSETADYTLDKDSGDLLTVAVQNNGVIVRANFKYAAWRDQNWLEALNRAIDDLNGRGFFRQIVRQAITLSAGVRSFSAPSGCVDLYELVVSPLSGSVVPIGTNWSYQQDANKIVLGNAPTTRMSGFVSYLRNLRTYNATSATLDILSDWVQILVPRAGAQFNQYLAQRKSMQGAASIDEGHFSFTNFRTLSNDLDTKFDFLARKKKPTRPAKTVGYAIEGGGTA